MVETLTNTKTIEDATKIWWDLASVGPVSDA